MPRSIITFIALLLHIINVEGDTGFIEPADTAAMQDEPIPYADSDTTSFHEKISDLPEVIVRSGRHKFLHLLAYVREYSSMTTYSDTVFLLREKMVDYVLPPDKKSKFKGWAKPRIIKTRSYYRFTDSQGLDSVSDECNYHFSWSDWIGIAPVTSLPSSLRTTKAGRDTLSGNYGPYEIWTKNNDRVDVSVNLLSDNSATKWIPTLPVSSQDNFCFEKFKATFSYDNVTGDSISPEDLCGYSFEIETTGRGHRMFRFARNNEPYFVETSAEVYILDKEFITLKEARKWEKHDFRNDEIDIYVPMGIPPLDPSVIALTERVDNVDKDGIRLSLAPDHRLASDNIPGRNFRIGNRLLLMLKQLTGISLIKSRRNMKHNWNDFRDQQKQKNKYRGDK